MIVDEAQESIKSSTQPRMKLEMALLKMASLAHAADLRTALQQLDRLEKMARDGKLPAAPPPEMTTPKAVTPQPTTNSQPEAPTNYADEAPKATVREPEAPKQTASDPAPSEPGTLAENESADTTEASTNDASPESKQPDDPPKQASTPKKEPAPTEAASPSTLAPSLFGTPALKKSPRSAAPDDTEAKALFADAGTVQTLTRVEVATDPLLARIEALWPRYVQSVKTDRIHVGSLLQHTIPLSVESNTVTVGVPDEFHRRLLSSQQPCRLKHLVEMTPDSITNLTLTIHEDLDDSTPETVKQDVDPHAYMQRKREENPVIQAIFEQFGGELVW
jgi:DNA polymerase-3 subunit gamma/tau